jgi:hypothetical protein
MPVRADFIAFQNLPTTLGTPPNISFDNSIGPIIADDFVPVIARQVTTITWWGSAAASDTWELALYNNASGQPALTPAGNIHTGGVKARVTAVGVPYAPLPGVFEFTANFSQPFLLNVGTDYWITVANFLPGWNWAEALGGPTIGAEQFNAQLSTGGTPFPAGTSCTDSGPYCGPWTDIHTDFAVQLSAVPEPSSLVLLSTGLVAFVAARRRRGKIG